MKKVTNSQICLGLILLLAFLVRVWGVGFGLPAKHFIDEEGQIYGALYAAYSRLQPVRFMYASFVPYLLLAEYGTVFIIGKISGIYLAPFDFLVAYIRDPSNLFLLGRLTMVVAGTLSVWLIWKIGKKFYSKTSGLVAAGFLAIIFLHVKESHYVKQDVISTLFILMSFYLALLSVETKRLQQYLFTGVTLALAVSAKYQTLLIAPVLFIHYYLTRKKPSLSQSVVLGVGFVLTMLLLNPYFVLAPKKVIDGTLAEFAIAKTAYPELLQGHPVWWWFVFQHLPQGLGTVLFGASIWGSLVCVGRGIKNRKYLLIPLLPVVFLLTVDQWSQFPSARYAVMLLPFLALAAAIGLEFIFSFMPRHKARSLFMFGAILLVSMESGIRDVKFDYLLTRPDTRYLSQQWIESHIPLGTKILVESTVRPEYGANVNTPLTLSTSANDKRLNEAQSRGESGLYLQALKKANLGKVGYDIVATGRVDVLLDVFTSEKTLMENADYYVSSEVDYLVLSSWSVKPDMKPEFMQSVGRHYDLIAKFRPTYEFPDDPHLVKMDYAVLDRVSFWGKPVIFGPVIDIYKKRT